MGRKRTIYDLAPPHPLISGPKRRDETAGYAIVRNALEGMCTQESPREIEINPNAPVNIGQSAVYNWMNQGVFDVSIVTETIDLHEYL